MDTHLSLETKPFPGYMGCVFQHFGKVSPALFLNKDRSGDKPQILDRHARNQVGCCHPQIKPKVLFIETDSKFIADGFGTLTPNQTHSRIKALSHAKGAYHQIECVGQTFFEFSEPSVSFHHHKNERRGGYGQT